MRDVRVFAALGVGVAVVICAAAKPASAITVELAKNCRVLAMKAYPYKKPGKKAGTAQAERDYFDKCVASGGTMHVEPAGNGSGQSAAPTPPK
jgi:hypothetical protein